MQPTHTNTAVGRRGGDDQGEEEDDEDTEYSQGSIAVIGGWEMRRAKTKCKRNGNVGRKAAWLFL